MNAMIRYPFHAHTAMPGEHNRKKILFSGFARLTTATHRCECECGCENTTQFSFFFCAFGCSTDPLVISVWIIKTLIRPCRMNEDPTEWHARIARGIIMYNYHLKSTSAARCRLKPKNSWHERNRIVYWYAERFHAHMPPSKFKLKIDSSCCGCILISTAYLLSRFSCCMRIAHLKESSKELSRTVTILINCCICRAKHTERPM